MTAARRRAAAGQDPGLERHPLVDREARPRRASRGRPPARSASTFDRKPTLPRLIPSSGTSTWTTARAARRNVPSPPRTTRTSVVGSSRAAARRSRRPGPPTGRCRGRGTSRRPAPAARPPPRWWGCRRSRSARIVTGRSRSATRRRPGRRTRRRGGDATRNSRLPSGPRIGEAISAWAPSPMPRAWSMTRSSTSRWTAGSRTTPWSVRPRPASNWGLTRATIARPGAGRSVARDRPEHEPERDERDVDDRQVDRLRRASSRSSVLAFVALHRHDPHRRAAAPRRAGPARRRPRRRARRRAAGARP